MRKKHRLAKKKRCGKKIKTGSTGSADCIRVRKKSKRN